MVGAGGHNDLLVSSREVAGDGVREVAGTGHVVGAGGNYVTSRTARPIRIFYTGQLTISK